MFLLFKLSPITFAGTPFVWRNVIRLLPRQLLRILRLAGILPRQFRCRSHQNLSDASDERITSYSTVDCRVLYLHKFYCRRWTKHFPVLLYCTVPFANTNFFRLSEDRCQLRQIHHQPVWSATCFRRQKPSRMRTSPRGLSLSSSSLPLGSE